MITVTSYAIGDDYVRELNGLVASIEKNSLHSELVTGIGQMGSNLITLRDHLFEPNSRLFLPRSIKIPVDRILMNNWNNLGFVKAYWLYEMMFHLSTVYSEDHILLWLDADARVRSDLDQLKSDMRGADVGMVLFDGEHWLNGTIALRLTQENYEWIGRWWDKCKQLFRLEHNDWRLNDQIVMRNMMLEGDKPDIIDLGEKWASMPPSLTGEKKNPHFVSPRMPDAVIHHWQMSRNVIKGWNWPPPEQDRYPGEND